MWKYHLEISAVMGFGRAYLTLKDGILMDTELTEETKARLERCPNWIYIENSSASPSEDEEPPPLPEVKEVKVTKPKRRGRPKKGTRE